jgi:superfamily II DNA or RNA helicase
MTSVESAEGLIDFSGGSEDRKSLAKLQIEGSVALYNILSQQKLAYLADEVGMGKTYVALGTIALMRKKQPDLRVLYLLPKNNVRDKWVKDYKSFVEHNYLHDDLIVRSLDRTPAAPHVVCKSLEALIREAAQGNNQDIFLCTSSLSFALSSEVSSIEASLKKLESIYSVSVEEVRYLQGKLNQQDLTDSDKKELKKACKQLWAKAINRILPKFDLIVVDEAHNFKRGAESSDRNRNLSTILGTNSKCSSVNLIKNVLLLSATPYEYSLSELDNQFQLFGESVLANKDKITRESALPKFMVRRLNELQINGIKHTRNMYRDEHRTGENAEVQMNDSQKLFAALMQKRVSEHLRENFAGKYQTGLLASFESYVPSSLSEKEHLTFDGEDDERKEEAKDNNIIGQLISSYQQEFSQTPPHPKMDWVVKQLHEQIYTQGKKQLIFVRRVASVGELKKKFEESYDKEFIYEHIKHDNFVEQMYNYYLKNKYNDELNIGNNELLTTQNELEGDFASDDFFTWFYRGRNAYVESEIDKRKTSKSNLEWVTPFNYRNKINSRSTMFELNWAKLITSESSRHYKNDELIQFAQMLDTTNTDTDDQKRFQVAQYCYLRCLEVDEIVNPKLKQLAAKLVKYLYNGKPPKISLLDQTKLELALETETFFEQVNTDSYLQEIFPFWGKSDFICRILNENDPLKQDRAIHLREILRMIIGYICRVDHP